MKSKASKKLYIWPFLYLWCILYITILSRTPALFHTVKLIPFWSFLEFFKGYWSLGGAIALNIILFVPFGYLLAKVQGSGKAVLITCLAVSVAIELIQFFSYFGYLDIDDIITNFIGGVIGYAVFCRLDGKLAKIPTPFLALAAGVIGCFIVSGNTQAYETQFDFQITNVVFDEKQVALEGTCVVYGRKGLGFTIRLKKESREYFANTETAGERFTAVAELNGYDNYEIEVVFDGYRPISTRTWVNNGTIEYVEAGTPKPDTLETDLGFVVEEGVLKEYNPDYDLYIYQLRDRLYWLIGESFDADIIYQIYTNEPYMLPNERQKYGFDNRGFKIGSEKELTETMNCGKYRVFSDIIPNQYHISAVMVGMSRGADVIWKDYFRIHCHGDGSVDRP